jgi:hyperosmotically inducible protein
LNFKWTTAALAVCLAAAPGAANLAAQSQPSSKTQPDNTKVNTRDRSKGEPTADQGKNNATDRDMAKKIRQAIIADKNLSTYAHNVKIIAQGGKVTLKGPVRSEEEKRTVEQKATDVAGAGNVTDEITIKPAKKSS